MGVMESLGLAMNLLTNRNIGRRRAHALSLSLPHASCLFDQRSTEISLADCCSPGGAWSYTYCGLGVAGWKLVSIAVGNIRLLMLLWPSKGKFWKVSAIRPSHSKSDKSVAWLTYACCVIASTGTYFPISVG